MTAHISDTAPTPGDAGPWEPWVPEVGQRVICTPSPECRVRWLLGLPPGHPTEETGVWGTVVPMPVQYVRESWARSHPYAVQFDYPGIQVNGIWWWGGMFAAIELIQPAIEDRADAAGGVTDA